MAQHGSVVSNIPFNDLCRRCEKISNLPRDKKAAYLQRYITWFKENAMKQKQNNPLINDSFYPVLRLLLPQLDRERGPYGIKEHTLAKVYIRILCLPKESHDAAKLMNYKSPQNAGNQAGDFADVAFWVLKNRCPATGSLTIEQVNTHLDNIASKHSDHDPRGVDAEIMIMLRAMSAEEQKWLIRILLKEMKMGLGNSKIFHSFHQDASELYDVTNSLSKVCEQLKDPTLRLHEIDVSIFSPFRAMLSERCDITKVEASMKKSLYYYVETKHDGERFQLHMKNGEFKYYSKNGFEFTSTFGGSAAAGLLTPHVVKLLRDSVKSCILDGEMMAWDIQKECYRAKGLNFDVKSLKPGDKHRPCFCVFDILLLNDKVLSNKPLEERYSFLDNLFVPAKGIIGFTKRRKVTQKEEVIEELNHAIDNRLEGIILKEPESVYKPNSRKGGWYKIKPEYTDGLMDHIDAVIIGGYYGGRKGIISHFLVGLAIPSSIAESSNPNEFHSVSRVGSGYTMAELAELLEKLEPHWCPVKPGECPAGIEWTKEKPDVWISPKHSYILEVKATEICYSNMFKVGYTLKFPRVEKIRYDKSWFECTTTLQFETLRKKADGKLSTRLVSSVESSEVSPKKTRMTRPFPTLGEQFQSADLSKVTSVSTKLAGKEFCVLTGSEKFTKQDIEIKIVENGGKIVQNCSVSSTYCAVAGKETSLRVRNVVKSGDFDVLRLGRLLQLFTEDAGLPSSWTPADLISASQTTTRKFTKLYDEFGDSYTDLATNETLAHALNQVKVNTSLDLGEMADFDIELFSIPSPYGIFRLCYAFFDKREESVDIVTYDFSFYGGKLSDMINDQTTHVIFDPGCQERREELNKMNHERERKFHVVSRRWVEESVIDRKRRDENMYYLT